ncbi:hypothetical protein AB4Y96_08025 [Phyllobacterium sp. TAF24]|uniref:hypothetical protein n=1 Tax=Phyllobacterium sp. TAF24 TaxID=3233068 RepID=UPI003F9509D8
MTRLLLVTAVAVTLAACSTSGGPSRLASYKANTGYAFKTDIDNGKVSSTSKAPANGPRLGFTGFSGTQIIGGIN